MPFALLARYLSYGLAALLLLEPYLFMLAKRAPWSERLAGAFALHFPFAGALWGMVFLTESEFWLYAAYWQGWYVVVVVCPLTLVALLGIHMLGKKKPKSR